jgi:hypothetical protein
MLTFRTSGDRCAPSLQEALAIALGRAVGLPERNEAAIA